MTDADVLIAGAGPAGCVAATILARAGVRVRVLERAVFPRDKLCGDTVNPGALAILARLGLSSVVTGGLRVDGMIVTGGATRVEGRYPEGVHGRALVRRHMDAALVDAARGAGARIDEGVAVEEAILESRRGRRVVTGIAVRRADGAVERLLAPLVVAADGRASRIARGLGLSRFARRPRRWAIGAHFEGVAGLTSCGEMHVRAGHYIGVAPLPGGLANACLVTAERAGLGDPAAALRRALGADARLSGRFAGARMIGRPTSIGPLAVDSDSAGMPGLLLAGDASGFVDPMTGDGLCFAFRGGELAAEAALRGLAASPDRAYRELVAARREAFAGKRRFNRALRALVGSPAAIEVASRVAARMPELVATVIRHAGDVPSIDPRDGAAELGTESR